MDELEVNLETLLEQMESSQLYDHFKDKTTDTSKIVSSNQDDTQLSGSRDKAGAKPETDKQHTTGTENQNLKKFLKKSVGGMGILASQKANLFLSDDDQTTLARLLCEWLLKVSHYSPKPYHYETLTLKICKLFPKEDSKVWYIPPFTEGPKQRCKKGKLPDRIRNVKDKLSKKGVILTNRKKKKMEEEMAGPADIQQSEVESTSIEWLKRNAEPFSEVQRNWKVCRAPRIRELHLTNMTASVYVERWNNILKLPEAHDLVLDDFEALHVVIPEKYACLEGKEDNLMKRWKNFSMKIVDLLKALASKKDVKKYTALLEGAPNENSKDLIILSMLPIICKNKGQVKIGSTTIKPSSVESTNAFIFAVPGAAEFQEKIRQRNKRYADLGASIQPFVAVTTKDEHTVTASYVIVDDIIWKTGSVLKAIDVCFKSCFTLDCEFSPEAAHLWLLIQRALYDITLPNDVSVSTVPSTLILEPENDSTGDAMDLEPENNVNLQPEKDENFSCLKSDNPDVSQQFDVSLTNAVLSFIATMYDIGLTEGQIQCLIDSQKNILSGSYVTILRQYVSKTLFANSVSDQDCKTVSRMFDSLENMFQGFETTYLRMKEFEACGAFIRPEHFVIGQALTEVTNSNGDVVLNPITLTGQFVPARKMLKGFLELPGVFNTIVNYMERLENDTSGKLENIIQGTLWNQNIKPKFVNKLSLGAHAGVHNLGAGYVRLPCLPPIFQGVLENIFKIIVFHSCDKSFGNKALFRKIVDELDYLEKEGITVVTPQGTYQVYFALIVAGGDNKGANEILGYVSSFSANFFCRICRMKSDETVTCTSSDPSKLRRPEDYEEELQINNLSLTGRKGVCVFNTLDSYHCYSNFHLDIMHDLDEGCWKYLMTDIVRFFIMAGRFSLVYLNELIQGFQYGPSEQRNKFPLITSDHLKKDSTLKGSASEMRCLIRYFGLIIGHLIQKGDQKVWDVYLKARSIVDIVTAPCIPKNIILNLKKLIKDFLTMYLAVFKTHLRPKFHNAIHIPEVIELLGPLEPLSCIRIEASHKQGTEVAKKSHNRLNLPLTVITRYQMKFCFRLLSERGLVTKFECSRVQSLLLHCISDYLYFKSMLPPEHLNIPLNVVKWVNTNGMTYREDTVVLHSVINDVPLFGLIHLIYIGRNNDVNLVLKCLKVMCFDKHFHAWEVKHCNEYKFIKLNQLRTHVTSELRTGGNGKRYVAFRFGVAYC
ncbi:F-box protein [Frankliniella fusca]|uniref:F-box protein n=1 Tax=Frankliniella fusca TaxID=407009 RepID=A0AAE1HRS5_9NEOP|nr:F-box protein [Frankliniella fusca]